MKYICVNLAPALLFGTHGPDIKDEINMTWSIKTMKKCRISSGALRTFFHLSIIRAAVILFLSLSSFTFLLFFALPSIADDQTTIEPVQSVSATVPAIQPEPDNSLQQPEPADSVVQPDKSDISSSVVQPGKENEPETAIEIKTEAETRERGAGEDPLAKELSLKEDRPEAQAFRPNKLELYGSIRARLFHSKTDEGLDDNNSRFGLNGQLQFRPKFWLSGRAEAGFNLIESIEENQVGSKDNVSLRLFYTNIETPSTVVSYGKNWSSYYQVSGLTDRFTSFGADASGTFNAQTDGGPTGTGRADYVLQGRISADFFPKNWGIKPFKLNLQGQNGEPIPFSDTAKYNYAFGASAIFETEGNFNLGIAYNHADVDSVDLPELNAIGIDGDAQALVLGTRYFGENTYLATTVSYLANHETTDSGIYFDGYGWEMFGSYKLYKKWWVIGGWNLLKPKSDQNQAGEYSLRYGVVGLRYSFEGFHKMIYTEIKIDDSQNADGTAPGSIATLGVRWDLP